MAREEQDQNQKKGCKSFATRGMAIGYDSHNLASPGQALEGY